MVFRAVRDVVPADRDDLPLRRDCFPPRRPQAAPLLAWRRDERSLPLSTSCYRLKPVHNGAVSQPQWKGRQYIEEMSRLRYVRRDGIPRWGRRLILQAVAGLLVYGLDAVIQRQRPAVETQSAM